MGDVVLNAMVNLSNDDTDNNDTASNNAQLEEPDNKHNTSDTGKKSGKGWLALKAATAKPKLSMGDMVLQAMVQSTDSKCSDEEDKDSNNNKADAGKALQNLRRLSNVFGGHVVGLYDKGIQRSVKKKDEDDDFGIEAEKNNKARRQTGVGHTQMSSQRRIVLSNKLESAMELLDGMERPAFPKKNKWKSIMNPLSAYLTWTSEWKNEFSVGVA